ncbi:MAG: D-alanyl-D-alanine carboxypeptidase family protein [Alphaproteobacteria bacterium]|nr:D-alanyl-D-alanine carboxypeptidase family protein [Alphaproteobacteria bacterium]
MYKSSYVSAFKPLFFVLVAFFALDLFAIDVPPTGDIETHAKQVLLIDKETGTVLFERNPDELMAPSSMSKLMLAYMVFDRLKNGKNKMTDEFTVSKEAWKMRGSRMFLKADSKVTLDQLIHGLVVQSGNDAAIALAEGLYGSEQNAVDKFNQKAKDLGLKHSHFGNVTGLPNPEHVMTARDLSILANRIMDDFPEYYPLFSIKEYNYNNITQPNLNPLLKLDQPADGLKTGHTDKGGYGLVASIERGGRRLVLVINGLKTMWNREQDSKHIVEWAFSKYKNYRLFQPFDVVDVADIWLGDKPSVQLIIKDKVVVNMLKKSKQQLKVELIYDAPLVAPFNKDTPVGQVKVTAPGAPVKAYHLYPAEDSSKLRGFSRVKAAFNYLLFGADKRQFPTTTEVTDKNDNKENIKNNVSETKKFPEDMTPKA